MSYLITTRLIHQLNSFNMSYFLFESSRPIKGYNRSIIYDLQRRTYDFIPNDLYAQLITNNINDNKASNHTEYHDFCY